MAHKHHIYNECNDIDALTIKEYRKDGNVWAMTHNYELQLTPDNALDMLRKIANDVIMEELMDSGEVKATLTQHDEEMADKELASGHDSIQIETPHQTYLIAIVHVYKDSMR